MNDKIKVINKIVVNEIPNKRYIVKKDIALTISTKEYRNDIVFLHLLHFPFKNK